MPRLGGVEATRRIKRVHPGIHVIGVSSEEGLVIQEAMQAAGASRFVTKDWAHTLPHVIAQITGRYVAGDALSENIPWPPAEGTT